MKKFGELGIELIELERYGGKEKPGAQSSVRVRNITNRCCVLLQCTTVHIADAKGKRPAGIPKKTNLNDFSQISQ
jgi:hypothetical protein